MGLKKGDDIVLMKKGKHILIEKADTLAKMQDEFEDLQEFSEESLKRLWSNKEDEIWDRYYHMNLPDLTSDSMPFLTGLCIRMPKERSAVSSVPTGLGLLIPA